mmetsp:Transcript_3168/g.10929  ORF Transcript_3168/g.10929 Transcript_3168/m.10929 type:complete len:255 (-) Transcript_3168:61-825(-)
MWPGRQQPRSPLGLAVSGCWCTSGVCCAGCHGARGRPPPPPPGGATRLGSNHSGSNRHGSTHGSRPHAGRGASRRHGTSRRGAARRSRSATVRVHAARDARPVAGPVASRPVPARPVASGERSLEPQRHRGLSPALQLPPPPHRRRPLEASPRGGARAVADRGGASRRGPAPSRRGTAAALPRRGPDRRVHGGLRPAARAERTRSNRCALRRSRRRLGSLLRRPRRDSRRRTGRWRRRVSAEAERGRSLLGGAE